MKALNLNYKMECIDFMTQPEEEIPPMPQDTPIDNAPVVGTEGGE